MSTLEVPGAQLYYEVSGSGPLFILIPGASGTGESFHSLVPHLISQYQAVTYDRRGFSRSTLDGPQDYAHRLATDADDVRRLIEHIERVTDQPAMVFGNSSGALVALEVLIRFSAQLQTVIAHEPPIVSLLSDAGEWLAFFDEVYEIFRQQGVPPAMHQFASRVLGSLDRQVLERAMLEHADEYTLSNAEYWMEHELRQYPRAEFDLTALTAHAEQIVLAGGRDSHNQMTYQPNKALAQQLGSDVVDMPGGHLGFLPYPAAFAAALMNALGGTSW